MKRAGAVAFFALAQSAMVSPALAQESTCEVTWPEDLKAPIIKETFPLKGTAGYAAFLQLKITHLPGERVFPAGIQLTPTNEEDTGVSLEGTEFRFPDLSSRLQPKLIAGDPKEGAETVTTEVSLPLIPLPAEPGRKELTLPRLPISVSRASGQVHTLCTQPHVITVEDPLASVPNPEPKGDPKPRPQLEIWTALRDAVLAMLIALPLAVALAWLILRFRSKFKKAPKPPPPRPPWETAFEQLDTLEGRGLLKKDEYEEYLDGVSDTLREYLGARYGFDGLESTTRETLRQLASTASDFDEDRAVRTILQRADLVKFARRLPSEEECRDAMAETRRLIRKTIIAPSLDPRGASDRQGSAHD